MLEIKYYVFNKTLILLSFMFLNVEYGLKTQIFVETDVLIPFNTYIYIIHHKCLCLFNPCFACRPYVTMIVRVCPPQGCFRPRGLPPTTR